MSKAFSLGSILNEKTLSQAKNTHKVVYLDINSIKPNPANEEIYNTDGVEMLSYSIEDKGLLQPLVVRKINSTDENTTDTYEIISGHRRRLAILDIIERNSPKANDFKFVPCIVYSKKDNNENENDSSFSADDEELLDGNLFNRNKTDAEKAKEIAAKKQILQKRKADGEVIAGKILDIIAQEMGISSHQAKKFNAINQNASDNAKEAFEKGEISTETAYELSKADKDTQDDILKKSNKSEKPLTAKDVKEKTKKSNPAKEKTSSADSDLDNPLPYGMDVSLDNEIQEGISNNSKSTRLGIVTKLAGLMKKFTESSEEIIFNEKEIKEAQDILNSTYQYISDNK